MWKQRAFFNDQNSIKKKGEINVDFSTREITLKQVR